MLGLAALGMGASGQIDRGLLLVAAGVVPVTLAGSWLGVNAYGLVSERVFRRIVLGLLMTSGAILVVQTLG